MPHDPSDRQSSDAGRPADLERGKADLQALIDALRGRSPVSRVDATRLWADGQIERIRTVHDDEPTSRERFDAHQLNLAYDAGYRAGLQKARDEQKERDHLLAGNRLGPPQAVRDAELSAVQQVIDEYAAALHEWEDWSNELAALIPDGDESRYSDPEAAQEAIIEDCLRVYQHDSAVVRGYVDAHHRELHERIEAEGPKELPDDVVRQAKVDALVTARHLVSQHLVTGEKWRYDRVLWAFGIMLGEIPEDTPAPVSPEEQVDDLLETAGLVVQARESTDAGDEQRRADIDARVKAHMARLDGTERAAVAVLTGLTVEEIDDLGGVPRDPGHDHRA